MLGWGCLVLRLWCCRHHCEICLLWASLETSSQKICSAPTRFQAQHFPLSCTSFLKQMIIVNVFRKESTYTQGTTWIVMVSFKPYFKGADIAIEILLNQFSKSMWYRGRSVLYFKQEIVATKWISAWITWKISCDSGDFVVETTGCLPKSVPQFFHNNHFWIGIWQLSYGRYLPPLQLDVTCG